MRGKIIPQFICRSDNFGILIHDGQSGQTLAVDAPDAGAIEAELEAHGWRLTDILLTHHHEDHVAGVETLRQRHGAHVTGHGADAHRLPRLDAAIMPGEDLRILGEVAEVIATPGHTSGQLAYFFPGLMVLFAGDCLFSLGCGRLFEGTPAQMWPALDRLRRLPAQTRLYCGHEYTQANARFALSVEPGNAALVQRAQQVDALRQHGKPTLPSLLGDECATNPFLRPESPEIRAHFNLADASNMEVFAALRAAKDQFR